VTPHSHTADALDLGQLPTLLRGEAQPIQWWIEHWSARRMMLYGLVIVAGTAAFGGAIGIWRDPLQALYTAIKFPLIILLTALGNGLLNGMLAPLLGVNISFRQSLLAVFMSFTIAAAVLGACSPIVWFSIWNSPPLSTNADQTATTYGLILVVVVAVIALAGIAGNLRLWQLLRQLSGSRSGAGRTLLAWLAGNLLLGSQLSWILRPFIGSPSLPLQFVRDDALRGNFFETLFRVLQRLLS
jgi:hypothetical protein